MSDVRPLSDLAEAILDDDDGGRNVGKFEKQRSLQDLHGPKKRQWKPNVSTFFQNVVCGHSRIKYVNYNNEVIRTKY